MLDTYQNWKMNRRSEHQAWTSLQTSQDDPYMQNTMVLFFLLYSTQKNFPAAQQVEVKLILNLLIL